MPEPPEDLHQANITSPVVASSPSSPKATIPIESGNEAINSIPTENNAVIKKATSCTENKHKYIITSDRLCQLRKRVELAVREHRIFTIKGGWPVIRRELLKRNWIEKYETNLNKAKSSTVSNINADELTRNLPVKLDWETPAAYIDKCERTIMSRMLQNFDVNFYWSMRKDQVDFLHRSNNYKLMNRFNKSLFASKEGLALLLQQHYWYFQPGVSSVNFPRCYVLGFPDHYRNFVDDFRITACMGLLKWMVHKYDNENKIISVQTSEAQVPLSAIQFAMDRCCEFLESKKHVDIDKDHRKIWNKEWNQFLIHYDSVVHKGAFFATSVDHPLTGYYIKAKHVLNQLQKYWPEYNMDGMRNIWILKPGNKCRGRGIQLIKTLSEVEKVMNLKLKYVVQKYVEKPLLIYNTKFDIRQWFLVTNTQPLTIWMYRECYLRFSSQIFTLDNFHESLHLTNHAVQCKYTNVEQRDQALPKDNMWDSHTFQNYLKLIKAKDKWKDVIFPGIREGIVCAMLASQDIMDRRQNTFEIYGADFMISEDFQPWLIEINCSPDLSASTGVTRRMCPQCMADLVKVVVDRRRNPTSCTGLFDMIYHQSLPRVPPFMGVNLTVRGRKIKGRIMKAKLSTENKSKVTEVTPQYWLRKKQEYAKAMLKPTLTVPSMNMPKILTPPVLYAGPIIEDLIDNLSKSVKNQTVVKPMVLEVKKPLKSEVTKKVKLGSGKNKHEKKTKRKKKH